MLSTEDTLLWCERLLGLAVFLQSIELLQLRGAMSARGVWQWALIRSELRGVPAILRRAFDQLLEYPNVVGLISAQLAAAGTILILPPTHRHWLPLFVIFTSTVLIAIRFRGTFNGGSDYMTTLVALMLLIARLFPLHSTVGAACLYYIAVQTCLSYFVAGIVKIRNTEWHTGSVLPRFLNTPRYAAPSTIRSALSGPSASVAASWGVMVFECAFPAALFSPRLATALISAAFLFHLTNVFVFGLNRFLFAWMSTYPAVYWASLHILTPGLSL